MSMQSPLAYQIPHETARVARAAFPKGNLYMQMQAELGMIYTNPQFMTLFSPTGQPAEDPARLALILVMQMLEGLPDRQAADAVRGRIDWKYALALELTDPGFDASVLSEFRTRLLAGGLEMLLLDTLLANLQDGGLVQARGKQRTDSTKVLAAIRVINRLELIIETMRFALNRLATLAPDWLWRSMQPGWQKRYDLRAENSRLPGEDTKRQALVAQVGADGFALLAAVDAPATPDLVRNAPAVAVLRRVWIQQYYGPADPPRWRMDDDTPPPGQIIHSPYDDEARYSTKYGDPWVGYQVHYTETCDAERPHLIINVRTTPATLPDDTVLPALHDDLAAKGLLPAEHLVDAGYTNADNLHTSQTQHQLRIVGPVAADPSWQARTATGFAQADFTLDWEQQIATCPQGKRSVSWRPHANRTQTSGFLVRFGRAACAACPVRSQCTRAKTEGRSLFVLPRTDYEKLRAARASQQTDEFRAESALRAGVESLISQGIRAFALRKSRYVGCAKTQLQHILIAVAINIVRLAAWWRDPKPTPPRTSAFARLATLT